MSRKRHTLSGQPFTHSDLLLEVRLLRFGACGGLLGLDLPEDSAKLLPSQLLNLAKVDVNQTRSNSLGLVGPDVKRDGSNTYKLLPSLGNFQLSLLFSLDLFGLLACISVSRGSASPSWGVKTPAAGCSLSSVHIISNLPTVRDPVFVGTPHHAHPHLTAACVGRGDDIRKDRLKSGELRLM